MPSTPSPYRRIPGGRHGLTAEEVLVDQVARIQAAMVQAVAESGYGSVAVEQVIGIANVSRRAFYARFADKEACFLATFEVVFGEWREQLSGAFWTHGGEVGGDPQKAVRAALLAVFEQAGADPLGARVLFIEAAAAGPPGQARVAEIVEVLIAVTMELLRGGANEPVVSVEVAGGIVGAIIEMVAGRVLSGRVRGLPELVDPLTNWTVGYASAEARSILEAIKPSEQAHEPPVDLGIPTLGHSGLWHEQSERPVQLPEDPESRILAAVVEIAGGEGYAALSINRIVNEAHVSQHTFRSLFPTAHAAFMAAFVAGGRETMASCLPVMFAANNWAASVVAGLTAQTRFLGERPALARFGFLPVLSAGADGMKLRRMELEVWSAALQPGFRRRDAPPLIYGEAIAGSIFRLQQHLVVRKGPEALRDLGGSLAYLALEPFTGPLPAAELIGARV